MVASAGRAHRGGLPDVLPGGDRGGVVGRLAIAEIDPRRWHVRRGSPARVVVWLRARRIAGTGWRMGAELHAGAARAMVAWFAIAAGVRAGYGLAVAAPAGRRGAIRADGRQGLAGIAPRPHIRAATGIARQRVARIVFECKRSETRSSSRRGRCGTIGSL